MRRPIPALFTQCHVSPPVQCQSADPLSLPGVLDVALVSQQDGGEVARQLLLAEGLQEAASSLEAGPLTHRVHHQKGVVPAEVPMKTCLCLKTTLCYQVVFM